MKQCRKCLIEKPVDAFGVDITARSGRHTQCKQCKSDAAKARYQADPEKHIARSVKYQALNQDAVKKRSRSWREANLESIKRKAKEYREENREENIVRMAKWRTENPEKSRMSSLNWYRNNIEVAREAARSYFHKNKEARTLYSRAWNKNNPQRARELHKRWYQANRAIKTAISSRYRARKIKATPKWANDEAINGFYRSAEGLSMLLGDWYEVDHIIPLKNDLVCGLHCEFNLQILHHKANASKGNRWWPDMPDKGLEPTL